jgi:hypothetical protein
LLRNEGRLDFREVGLPVPAAPSRLIAADLDGDRDQDLVIGDLATDLVLVLRNEGAGRFAPISGLFMTHAPGLLTAFDFDGDGDLDLATAWSAAGVDPGGIALLRNNGHGSFALGPEFALEGNPAVAAAGDFDGDGIDDLAIGISGDRTCIFPIGCRIQGHLVILLSDGKGGFAAKAFDGIQYVPRSLAASDLDGDGTPDLAVLLGWIIDYDVVLWLNEVQVLLNRGAGQLRPSSRSAVGTFPSHLLAADLNGDGKPDLAEASSASVSILLNGTGALAEDVDRDGVPDACRSASFRRGDANRDGPVDIADAIAVLFRLFVTAPVDRCEDAEDSNDDGAVDIADAVSILGHLFLKGPPIPPPTGSCGHDPTEDGLDCELVAPCR